MDKLERYLKEIYTKDKDYTRLSKEIRTYHKSLPQSTSGFVNPAWYKYINLYVIYPDAIVRKGKSSIQELSDHLPHIKDLGCNSVHILPFFETSFVDRGFDIKNYYKVDKTFGTMGQIKKLRERADDLGLKIIIDLVLNHVSMDHEWAKRAQAGDKKYREFFFYREDKPNYLKTFEREAAVWALYEEKGKKVEANIAFPDQAGEIPHWTEGQDGLWYYHTYYPEQLDLNWFNPEVFLEIAKVAMYWTSMGFNFRLDAIPFVGKKPYKNTQEQAPMTNKIVEALNYICTQLNSESIFLVESYEVLPSIISYFGDNNHVRAQLAYNFFLSTYLWVSYIYKDTNYLWRQLEKMKEIPSHAVWLNFLRNHDELSLAYLDEKTLKSVHKNLLKNGALFRKRFGISGRTYSFLGHNPRKHLMMYFLLASLPGNLMLPYGDEVGKRNIPMSRLSKELQYDTRNINRGKLLQKEINSAKGKFIYHKMSEILTKRTHFINFTNIWPERINFTGQGNDLFSARYTAGASELIVLVNLSKPTKKIQYNFSKHNILCSVNNIKLAPDYITLGSYAAVWLSK